jgi:chromosome segregation ATPase
MERAIKMLDADIEALQTNLEKWEIEIKNYSTKLEIAQHAATEINKTIEEIRDAIVQLALTN